MKLFLISFGEFLLKLETPKKRTQVKATVNREIIQKVDGKLDNHIAMKKAERPKLLQPQAKEVLAHGNKEVSQGS